MYELAIVTSKYKGNHKKMFGDIVSVFKEHLSSIKN